MTTHIAVASLLHSESKIWAFTRIYYTRASKYNYNWLVSKRVHSMTQSRNIHDCEYQQAHHVNFRLLLSPNRKDYILSVGKKLCTPLLRGAAGCWTPAKSKWLRRGNTLRRPRLGRPDRVKHQPPSGGYRNDGGDCDDDRATLNTSPPPSAAPSRKGRRPCECVCTRLRYASVAAVKWQPRPTVTCNDTATDNVTVHYHTQWTVLCLPSMLRDNLRRTRGGGSVESEEGGAAPRDAQNQYGWPSSTA